MHGRWVVSGRRHDNVGTNGQSSAEQHRESVTKLRW
jgi:hypothetical protein